MVKRWELPDTGMPRFIPLHFTTLHRYYVFYKLKICVNLPAKQVCHHHFYNSICSCYVSVSHFDNSHSISNFFIIICYSDLWCDYPVFRHHDSHPLKITNLTDKCACWLWVKHYQISLILHAKEKLFLKGRVNQCNKLYYCHILRNCHRQPNLQQRPPWPVSSHQHPGRTFHQQKNYSSLKAQMMVNKFSAMKYFLTKIYMLCF